MDIRQMEYFLTVCEEGQITKAARRLNMAQPPLSQQIQKLEEEAGTALLERNGHRIFPTEAGALLYERAKQVLALVRTTEKDLYNMGEGRQGTLRLGMVMSSSAFVLQSCLPVFHSRYPQARLQLWEGDTNRVAGLVDQGIAEIGIIRTPFSFENYSYADDGSGNRSPMLAVFQPQWIPDLGAGDLPFNLLKNKPLIIHRRHEQNVIEACTAHGFVPDLFCRCDDVRSMLTLAATGMGVCLIPQPRFHWKPESGVRTVRVEEPLLMTGTAVIWRKDVALSPVAENFIRIFCGPDVDKGEPPENQPGE